jgi:site-specific recombinase XerD
VPKSRARNAHPHLPPDCPLSDVLDDFALTLRGEGKAAWTIETYRNAAEWVAALLPDPGQIIGWDQVSRQQVKEHMAWLNATYSPAYCSNQHRALLAFAKYLEAEQDTPAFMRGVRAPHVPGKLVPVIPESDMSKLLAACRGKRFTNVRDTAIVRFFASTGCRRMEVAGLKVAQVDLDACAAFVQGKACKQRIVRFDEQAARDIAAYLRRRRAHRDAGLEWLWIGQAVS